MLPIIIITYALKPVRLIPNWMIKFIILLFTLPFYAITGLYLVAYYPPFVNSIFAALVCVAYVLILYILTLKKYFRWVSNERCPRWLCHAWEDYEQFDSESEEWNVITTTTTTYGDGMKSVQKKVDYHAAIYTPQQCNKCGRYWVSVWTTRDDEI
jgi:hypothetical protein